MGTCGFSGNGVGSFGFGSFSAMALLLLGSLLATFFDDPVLWNDGFRGVEACCCAVAVGFGTCVGMTNLT